MPRLCSPRAANGATVLPVTAWVWRLEMASASKRTKPGLHRPSLADVHWATDFRAPKHQEIESHHSVGVRGEVDIAHGRAGLRSVAARPDG